MKWKRPTISFFKIARNSKRRQFFKPLKKIRSLKYFGRVLNTKRKNFKFKLKAPDKLTFFMATDNFMATEAYKLFSLLEMQLSAVLLRSQIVPFFFIVPDLCFYRLVFINGKSMSNPHFIIAVYDTVQLPVFLYQLMHYRQNRFYYYPKHLLLFFKSYWGQFVDYTNDKIWLLSNAVISKLTAEILTFSSPNIILYMSPFRRFSKLYYRQQPERLRGEDSYLMYTHTVFKLKLFNYILYYK